MFSGRQLGVLAVEVLRELGVFTYYTDTDGLWIIEKDSGDPITKTVWTRCTPALPMPHSVLVLGSRSDSCAIAGNKLAAGMVSPTCEQNSAEAD